MRASQFIFITRAPLVHTNSRSHTRLQLLQHHLLLPFGKNVRALAVAVAVDSLRFTHLGAKQLLNEQPTGRRQMNRKLLTEVVRWERELGARLNYSNVCAHTIIKLVEK